MRTEVFVRGSELGAYLERRESLGWVRVEVAQLACGLWRVVHRAPVVKSNVTGSMIGL